MKRSVVHYLMARHFLQQIQEKIRQIDIILIFA